MASRRVEYATEARADLRQIFSYIAEKSGAFRANAVASRLERKFALLASRPGMGRPPRGAEPGSRSFVLPPWRIYYDPMPDGGILIVRVIDVRRDLGRVFDSKP